MAGKVHMLVLMSDTRLTGQLHSWWASRRHSCCYSPQSAARGRMGLVSTKWTPSRAPTTKHQSHTTQPVSLPPHGVCGSGKPKQLTQLLPP